MFDQELIAYNKQLFEKLLKENENKRNLNHINYFNYFFQLIKKLYELRHDKTTDDSTQETDYFNRDF